MVWNVGGMGKAFWAIAVQGWIVVYFLAALALLSYFVFGRVSPARLFLRPPEMPGMRCRIRCVFVRGELRDPALRTLPALPPLALDPMNTTWPGTGSR